METETLTDQQAIRVLALVADHREAVPNPDQLRELDARLGTLWTIRSWPATPRQTAR